MCLDFSPGSFGPWSHILIFILIHLLSIQINFAIHKASQLRRLELLCVKLVHIICLPCYVRRSHTNILCADIEGSILIAKSIF